MNTIRTAIVLLFLAGCATINPPKELVDARAANKRASEGVTAQLNPADLHSAEESLKAAERSFSDDGDSQQTKDLAYTADLRFQTAESRARAMLSARQKTQTVDEMHANVAASGQRTSAQLGLANQQLATQGQALQTEQQRRIEAEKKAAQASADLIKLGAVKNEARGMVLTLSGGVLFATNQSVLLPSAQTKLNEIAEVLINQSPDSKVVVEGYTDSQGTAAHNQELSQQRAKGVRDYLVSRGVASDRITSEGYGITRPVADNASAEGRANNRRVEIVVQ